MADIAEEKKLIRKEIKERWKKLDPALKAVWDEKVRKNLFSLKEYKEAKTIFAFVGTDTEVNTIPILKKILSDGKILAVPRCTGKGIMDSFLLTDLSQLESGKYGILEPSLSCPKVDAKEIDFAVVPSVSADRSLGRLGHGGGYYDRFMENGNFLKVLISYEYLLVDKVPEDVHDIPCDYLVTEEKIYKR